MGQLQRHIETQGVVHQVSDERIFVVIIFTEVFSLETLNSRSLRGAN